MATVDAIVAATVDAIVDASMRHLGSDETRCKQTGTVAATVDVRPVDVNMHLGARGNEMELLCTGPDNNYGETVHVVGVRG